MRSFDDRMLTTHRVTIAGDDLDAIDQVTLLLKQSLLPIDIVGTGGTRQCLQMARDHGPDAVLVIDLESKVDALEISRSLYRDLPGTATIILTESKQSEDPRYIRRAMRNKASDILSMPPLLDALTRSIVEAVKLEGGRQPRRARRGWRVERGLGGQVVVLYSPKGGVGKSVLAANLAALIAKNNPDLRVALIDLDLRFGDQAVLLDLDRSRSILDLISVIDELTDDAIRNAVTTHSTGLRVLLPPAEPQQADLVEARQVMQILLTFKRSYDLVIVDTASALSEVTLTALELADRILQICTPDVLSIWKTRASLELWEGLGISQESVWLVFNQTSDQSEVRPEQIRDLFANRVLSEIPADFFSIQPYINTGITLVEAPKGGKVLDSLRKIAKELVPKLEELPAQRR